MLTFGIIVQGIILGLWFGIITNIYINNDVSLFVIMIAALSLGGLMVPIVSTMSAFVSTMWWCCCGLSTIIGLALFDGLIGVIL